MFVYSVRSKHVKFFLLILFVAVTAVSLFVLARDSCETAGGSAVQIKAADHSERMAFLSQFGWEVSEEPVEVTEVIIPSEFDETYTEYNEIQKAQGFDLSAYAGMRVKRWTYSVKNYPGYENQSCIRANLLVYDSKIIGGDICSVELDGFMHGFSMPKTDGGTDGTN